MISSRVPSPRLPVGSSARVTLGSLTSARAIATRCCSPPDSSPGRWAHRSVSPTSARAAAARLRAVAGTCREDRGDLPGHGADASRAGGGNVDRVYCLQRVLLRIVGIHHRDVGAGVRRRERPPGGDRPGAEHPTRADDIVPLMCVSDRTRAPAAAETSRTQEMAVTSGAFGGPSVAAETMVIPLVVVPG